MQDSLTPKSGDPNADKEESPSVQPDLHAEGDGRNKEWEDRARVNLESVPEGTQTNVERDFEPEQNASRLPDHPAY